MSINPFGPPQINMTMTTEPELDPTEALACVDCAHCFISWYETPFVVFPDHADLYRCRKLINKNRSEVNLITGKRKIVYYRCNTARSTDICGPEGKHWTPKHKKDLFKLLKK